MIPEPPLEPPQPSLQAERWLEYHPTCSWDDYREHLEVEAENDCDGD